MVNDDDLPDEIGGAQPAHKQPAPKRPACTDDLPGDLPDEDYHGVDREKIAGGDSVQPGDHPSPGQLAGVDYYATLEGVEKELEGIADSLEIGAWEGQDVELRTQIKCLQTIRLTLNNAINRS